MIPAWNPLPHVVPTAVHKALCPPNKGELLNPSAYGIRDSNETYDAKTDFVQLVQRSVDDISGERKRKGREAARQVVELGRRPVRPVEVARGVDVVLAATEVVLVMPVSLVD